MLRPEKLKWLYNMLDRITDADEDWWPVRYTREEIAIGAVLTQNTNWNNVERALDNLASAGLLDFKAIDRAGLEELKELVRPAGFYNQKAVYLKALASFMVSSRWKGLGLPALRQALLGVKGIGKETADSILLYYFELPSFVIDAYTRRLLYRLFSIEAGYDSIKEMFESAFPPVRKNVPLYKKYHAMIVEFSKQTCRKKPLCGGCRLASHCNFTQNNAYKH